MIIQEPVQVNIVDRMAFVFAQCDVEIGWPIWHEI